MILFTLIAEIFIITTFNFLANSLPSGTYGNNFRRHGRGIFGPEPKLLENHDSIPYNDTNISTDMAIVTTEIPSINTKKKWQVGRVSRKQYEIVNMIWRKTKIFLHEETTTHTPNNEIKTYFTLQSTIRNTEILNRNRPTESYIEFYYLDEVDYPGFDEKNRSARLSAEYIKSRPQISVRNSDNFKPEVTNSPFLAFHVNASPQTKPQTVSTMAFYKLASSSRSHPNRLSFPFLHLKSNSNRDKSKSLWEKLNYIYSTTIPKPIKKENKNVEDYRGETCPLTIQPLIETTTEKFKEVVTENIAMSIPTTIYDKIKFFEIYDRHTENNHKSCDYQSKNKIESKANGHDSKKNVKKILLEHVDVTISHYEGIHNNKAKKQINKNDYVAEIKSSTKSSTPAMDDYFAQTKLNISNYSSYNLHNEATERESYVHLSKAALWSDYPFMAVYVYEPSQVLCDAAAISQHWLITAGSCLSRQHRLELTSEGQSAFVTYCGAAWRQPERIAYVKYTLVHPKYNPRDRSRRFLYNIGVVQVVGSMMSACFGWAPITLMSHQFTTHFEGSTASAVGWGLDRYAAKYPDAEISTHPLMIYNGLIHSDHCPGNIGYNEAKQVEPLHVMKNVYCLSLPPYIKEETDPVHGSLLFIGGKLIALYLQEERRGWGEQSAQYTGVWRLIPWVQEVTREPENIDAFTADI